MKAAISNKTNRSHAARSKREKSFKGLREICLKELPKEDELDPGIRGSLLRTRILSSHHPWLR